MDLILAAIERVADKRHARLLVLGEAVAAERVCEWLATQYATSRVYENPRRREYVRALYNGYAAQLGGGP